MEGQQSITRFRAVFRSSDSAEEAIWKGNGTEVKIIGNSRRDFLFSVNYCGTDEIAYNDSTTRAGGRYLYKGDLPRIAIKLIRRGRGGVMTSKDVVGLERGIGLIFRTDHIIGYDISEAARTSTVFIGQEAFDRVIERHFGTRPLVPWSGVRSFRLDGHIGHLIETALLLFEENHSLEPDCIYSEASVTLIKEALIVTVAGMLNIGAAYEKPRAALAASKDLVLRGLDIIRAQDQPLSIHDLAEMLGISVRLLQAGFRKHVGTPPHQLLRRGRIEGARRDLESGAAPTIADAARKWGFSNAGRFAGEYLAVAGEYPSDTVRRRKT